MGIARELQEKSELLLFGLIPWWEKKPIVRCKVKIARKIVDCEIKNGNYLFELPYKQEHVDDHVG